VGTVFLIDIKGSHGMAIKGKSLRGWKGRQNQHQQQGVCAVTERAAMAQWKNSLKRSSSEEGTATRVIGERRS